MLWFGCVAFARICNEQEAQDAVKREREMGKRSASWKCLLDKFGEPLSFFPARGIGIQE